jgi:hypothetical protein
VPQSAQSAIRLVSRFAPNRSNCRPHGLRLAARHVIFETVDDITSSGSGVFIDRNRILTAKHVGSLPKSERPYPDALTIRGDGFELYGDATFRAVVLNINLRMPMRPIPIDLADMTVAAAVADTVRYGPPRLGNLGGTQAHHMRDGSTTNAMESLISRTRLVKRNVKRWRSGQMMLRRMVAGISRNREGFPSTEGVC